MPKVSEKQVIEHKSKKHDAVPRRQASAPGTLQFL